MSFSTRRIDEKKRSLSDRLPSAASIMGFLSIAKPVLRWYGSWRVRYEKRKRNQHRLTLLKRVLLVLIAVLFVFLLLAGVAKAIMSVRLLSIGNIISITGNAPIIDEKGFTNILLLGQGDETGQDLTDSIMIASISTQDTTSVVLLSLPRDTYFLHTDKMEAGKINTMYRDYKNDLWLRKGMDQDEAAMIAIAELRDEIGRKLDLSIQHVIKVDFEAFIKAVDAVDGIDVDVPETIEDLQYPDGNFGYDPFIIQKGRNHLDGATALKYVRSRNTSSDFDRSARQQQVLGALGEKAKEKIDPTTIARLMQILSDHVVTTMSIREMIGLFAAAKDIKRSNIISMQLHDRNGLYGERVEAGGFLYAPPRDLFEGASVLLPVSIPEFPVTWKQIRTLKKLLIDTRTAYLARPSIAVLNGGAPSGAARKLGNELIRYGFNVEHIANSPLGKQDTSFVSPLPGDNPELAGFFAALLNVEAQALPAAISSESRRTITFVLGRDFRYTPLQNLL